MEKHPINLITATAKQHALLLQYPNQPRRRLVLLHGAGVPGEVTWTYLANYLQGWDEVLVVDLAGMGQSHFLNTETPSIPDYQRQVAELLCALDWTQYDIAGYSFGGMVAIALLNSLDRFQGRCFLLEPAMLLASQPELLQRKADEYRALAVGIQQQPDHEAHYRHFLNSVSPNRLPDERSEKLTLRRLRQFAPGFSQALLAVSDVLEQQQHTLVQWRSPWPGMSFVGELSSAHMHLRHQQLAEQSEYWRYVNVPNADHSLVFSKPRFIAQAMSSFVSDVASPFPP
ncbi:MAG: alpha/beta hydrolase [Bacterioplanes sp.]|nr:alpha/beta hydrolase [Bacterioplanes sp.]